MNLDILYAETVQSMGELAECAGSMIDDATADFSVNSVLQEDAKKLYESIEYEDKSKILNKANDFAKAKIELLANIFNDKVNHFLWIDRANVNTNSLNSHTARIKEIKSFYNSDYMKHIFTKWERAIIKESIDEYELKLDVIYNLLSTYQRDPINIKKRLIQLPNGKVVDHKVEELILPKRMEAK